MTTPTTSREASPTRAIVPFLEHDQSQEAEIVLPLDLPIEVWEYIFSRSTPTDVNSFGLTCRDVQVFVQTNHKIWHVFLNKHFFGIWQRHAPHVQPEGYLPLCCQFE